jgi:hypothetical protein
VVLRHVAEFGYLDQRRELSRREIGGTHPVLEKGNVALVRAAEQEADLILNHIALLYGKRQP